MQLVLDDWQKEVLAYNGDLLICTGRRVGKTQIMAIKAAIYMTNHPNHQIVIASLTEDQAKLIIIMILDYLEKHYRGQIDKTPKNKPTMTRLVLKNKARAIARPVGQTGDSMRGFNGNVLILDELSRFNKLIMEAATPILLTTGGQIWGASTPFGKQGFFWKMFDQAHNKQDPDARFKVFYKSSEEVVNNRKINQSWTEKQREMAIRHLEKEKKDMSEMEYGQEYLGLFLDDLQRFFPDELIEKCCKLKRRGSAKGRTSLGADLARLGGDNNAYSIIDDPGTIPYRQVESIIEKGKLTPETERDIDMYAELWKASKIGIDAGSGSLGVSIYDHLRETKWRNKVVAMNNRAMVMDDEGKKKQRLMKEDYYENLKSMMEHNEILLLDDEKVKLSLMSVQEAFVIKNDQPTKKEIFSNPHSESHAVEALVRAAYLAKKEKSLNLWVRYN